MEAFPRVHFHPVGILGGKFCHNNSVVGRDEAFLPVRIANRRVKSQRLDCGLSQHGGDGWVRNLRRNCSEHHRSSVVMIHFCLVHTAYHLHCWLPRSHRLRLQVVVFLFGIGTLTLQFYVLLRPRSSRHCSQPLLANLVGSIVFTFFTLVSCLKVINPTQDPKGMEEDLT
ncbi:hypothetical protein U0070_016040 [Myodes glareolus]|uniref:Uncharacterized protein n=1 Tax=Myodes glareolus TaxID=447135 RepID=A0AAW0I915_MYOGA